jgi:hypothetical protein
MHKQYLCQHDAADCAQAQPGREEGRREKKKGEKRKKKGKKGKKRRPGPKPQSG